MNPIASWQILTLVTICIFSNLPFYVVLVSTLSGIYSTNLMAIVNSRVRVKAYTDNGLYVWPEDQRLRGVSANSGPSELIFASSISSVITDAEQT